MFATRLLRNKTGNFQPIVNEVVNKILNPAHGIPAAKPRGFAVRGENGVVIPVNSPAEYIQAVSTDPKLKNLIFAGAGMEYYDVDNYHKRSLKHLGIAFALAVLAGFAYKVHNNAYMRDVRADYPKFEYINKVAEEQLALRRAAAAEGIVAAADEEVDEE